jgi:hypothetical protein
MMQLPALSAEERACIASGLPVESIRMLAQRIGLHLASKGIRAVIAGTAALPAAEPFKGRQPAIKIDPGLTSAWMELRYGGKLAGLAGNAHDSGLVSPLTMLVRRALAETVFNQGERASWPQAMQIQLQVGLQVGWIEIVWNRENAWTWARQNLRAIAERSGRT